MTQATDRAIALFQHSMALERAANDQLLEIAQAEHAVDVAEQALARAEVISTALEDAANRADDELLAATEDLTPAEREAFDVATIALEEIAAAVRRQA